MEKPIRILQVIGVMNRGGAETMIMNFYRNIDRSKIQFDFAENSFDTAAYDEEITQLGGKIYRCPHFSGKNYFAYKKWWKAFFNEHADEYTAIHGHIGSCAAIYLAEAKKHGIYTIAHSHNIFRKTIHDVVFRFFSFPTRYIADYFFACSAKAGISRYGNRKAKGNNFCVLNNAIDVKKFEFNEEIRCKIRNYFGFTDDQRIYGHVGRFETQKNHIFLLQIFRKIVDETPNAILLLVGGGVLESQIRNEIKQLGIEKNVIFAGIRDDVNDMLQAMDFFVFPSLVEGLGIVLIEAQASGLNCFISDAVPDEAILIPDFVTKIALKNKAEVWADTILNHTSKDTVMRKSCNKLVANAGYDIEQMANWLSNFYLGINKKDKK